MDLIREKLKLLPTKPGCYLMKDVDGNIIYVGKAKNLKNRVKSYFMQTHTGKTKALVEHINDFDYIVTNTNRECLILEINLIKKYNPKYNILLKDDKTYPYIALTNEKYPSVKIVRKKERKKVKDKLFGPYPNVVSARNTVDLINRIYPLKKCDHLKKDVCLYYHINQCLGYCKYDVDKSVIDKMVKEITAFLNGDYKMIVEKLEKQMISYSDSLNYEKALEIKNIISDIKTTISKQIIVSNIKYNFDVFGFDVSTNFLTIEVLFVREGVVIGKHNKIINDFIDYEDVYNRYIIEFYDKYDLPKQIVVNDIADTSTLTECLGVSVVSPKKGDVKKILNMANLNASIYSKEKQELIKRNDDIRAEAIKNLNEILGRNIHRIELFDNSHLFGTYYVGGMVVFDDFIANKKEYRKYKIDSLVKDDLSAMKEVIYRRYYRLLLEKSMLPDLVIVDGGLNQVRVALDIINSLGLDILVIGLKKDDKHRTSMIVMSDGREVKVLNNNLFLYLTRMQDEVHRFAISYHRDIKSKGSLASILDNVSGIGEKRRKQLLLKYKTINKIKEADIEDLSKIIPRDVAVELKKYLNEEL